MAQNLGQLKNRVVTLPAVYLLQTDEEIANDVPPLLVYPERHFLKPYLGDTGWYEYSLTLSPDPRRWFIAVNEHGWIMSAERDPTMITVEGVDIWEIDFGGEQMDLIAHKWTGEHLEDWNG